MTIEQTI